ncbi:MAG: sulfurtransferase [Actinomycetota bacterium]|nr:sulfurtransferase [Actinomycetota bacterium]MDQ2955689.1 sulfurtransferase [Actinomycetota bacterium]
MIDDSHRVLISVDQLAAALAKQPISVVLDVRWLVSGPSQYPAYLDGHLPGAQWCDLDRDLAAPPGPGGRHPLPDPARLQAALRGWGISADSEVVVYDADSSIGAARAWWVLRWAGLQRVRVLDGGLAAWLAADQPVQTEVERVEPGTVVLAPPAMPTLDADSAAAWAADGRLVDVRTPERFRGEAEPIDPVAGRIPGAVNLPTMGNVLPSGHFAPAAALRERFEGLAAVAGGQPVGVYCGSGVTAAHTALAMHVAGIDAVLYPGSWSEWITDPARPVATG